MVLRNYYHWLNRNSLLLSCIFGLVSFVILVSLKIQVILSYLPDISGSEMSTILPIQNLIDGNEIYTDPEKPPFRFTQYSPVYLCIVSSAFKLTGYAAAEAHKVFLASRLFSLVFTFGSVVVSGLLVYKISNKNRLAAIVSAVYIYHILSFWILTNSRPDSLMVLFTAAYLTVIYKATTTVQAEKWWYLAIFIAVTAFFVKQSGTVHSITIGLFFIIRREWKMLFKVVALGIATFILYLLILPINTIELFFTNIVGGVSNSVSWDWFYYWTMERWVLQFAVLFVINFTISFYLLYKKTSLFYTFLSLASFLFFAFATATSFKIGAGVGYYQDYLIISVIQIAVFLTDKNQTSKFDSKFSRIGLSLYLVFVYLHCTLFIYMTYRNIPSHNYVGQYVEQRKVVDYLHNEKKLKNSEWVLVDCGDNFRGYYIQHFLFNQSLIPFTDLVFLANENKTFQFSGFRDMVNKRQIKYVISDHGKKPGNILNYEFGNSIKLSSTIGTYDIYESTDIQNIE
jgi:hypothetical protein